MALTGLSTSPLTSFSCSTFPTFCHFLHMLGLSCLCGPVCAVGFLWNAIPLSPIWWIANDILRSNATTSSKKPAQAWPSPAHPWHTAGLSSVSPQSSDCSSITEFPMSTATVHGSRLFPCLSPSKLWTPARWDLVVASVPQWWTQNVMFAKQQWSQHFAATSMGCPDSKHSTHNNSSAPRQNLKQEVPVSSWSYWWVHWGTVTPITKPISGKARYGSQEVCLQSSGS